MIPQIRFIITSSLQTDFPKRYTLIQTCCTNTRKSAELTNHKATFTGAYSIKKKTDGIAVYTCESYMYGRVVLVSGPGCTFLLEGHLWLMAIYKQDNQ